jgi:hypothetical protein
MISCQSLERVICLPDGELREIHGFNECSSLKRVEICSSVTIIGCRTAFRRGYVAGFNDYGFHRCKSLEEVIFAEPNHVEHVGGFQHCPSIQRVVNPPSCWNFASCQMFLDHSVGSMTRSRRRIQLRFTASSEILDI